MKLIQLLWGREKPGIYEMVITQDGLSLEGNEKLGAHIEDILHYVEKKAEEIGLERDKIEVFIRNGNKTIAIKRIGGLGVAVVSSTIEEAARALKDVESRANDFLEDRYVEAIEEYRRSK
ncbi:hypothetical protein CL1_0081 [Thermococcus cleftensis]|uniref:Uncharacterized protein n=1 Tax=Thermococcus cleftensis (strain DSM 27260 / KACC 17922 / CL1) TaxID=163003 RepID=I3ZRG2_THECF|nr:MULTISPECIES: hypothetical protein [Thermococcus]AFL94296.1 hypothetical protein CL1_0081 [Thermococcus cleftensis]